jgi:PAS domain-containing protein
VCDDWVVSDPSALSHPEIQAELLGEAAVTASVGFLVWDESPRYVAVNDAACELLGATREQLLGRPVGSLTRDAEGLLEAAVAKQRLAGRVVVDRLDGSGPVEMSFVTFTVRSAAMPFMATVIWED